VGWRFWALDRDEDVSGVSGTGRKAYVIEALDYPGCLLVWDTSWVTVDWRPSMEVLEAIHGHDGRTRFTPLDDAPEARERALTLWRQVQHRATATFEAAQSELS
jgi:hypothetical protein